MRTVLHLNIMILCIRNDCRTTIWWALHCHGFAFGAEHTVNITHKVRHEVEVMLYESTVLLVEVMFH